MLLETGMEKAKTSLCSRYFMKLANWLAQRSIINRAWLTIVLLYFWLCCVNCIFFLVFSACPPANSNFKNCIWYFLGIHTEKRDAWLDFWIYGTVVELHPIKLTVISLLLAICFFFWCTKKYHELLVIMILLLTGLNFYCIVDPFAHFGN